MIAGTGTCAACRELAARAAAEGELGYVMCSACIEKAAADISPHVSGEDLEDALRAASGALPDGSLLIMVLVVNEIDGKPFVHQASNVPASSVRRRILESALDVCKEPS